MQSVFWQHIEDAERKNGQDSPDYEGAHPLLVSELPDSGRWTFLDPSDKVSPLVTLLNSLRTRAFSNASPCQVKIDPKNVTLRFPEGDDLIEVLLRKQEPGVVSFFWDASNSFEDGFQQLRSSKGRFVFLVRKSMKADSDSGKLESEEYRYYEPEALAIGFVRGDHLEVFAFPRDWTTHTERAFWQVQKMTAQEKALIDLDPQLAALVRLLGYQTVLSALEKHKD